MKVILNEDVYNLGEEGDVCVVRNGYARNFLLPQGLAVPYSKGTVKIFEQKKDQIEKRKEEKRKLALSLKEKLDGTIIEMKVSVGDTGKLFGSVNNANVAEELNKLGFNIERKHIFLPENHLKMIGEYSAVINLYGGEKAEIKVVLLDEKDKVKIDAVVEAVVEVEAEEVVEEEVVEEAADSEAADQQDA